MAERCEVSDDTRPQALLDRQPPAATVFNEAVSWATRAEGADGAENHQFEQIMNQRLDWGEGLVGSRAAPELLGGRPRRMQAQLPWPSPSPLHCVPVGSANRAGTRHRTETHAALRELSLKVET